MHLETVRHKWATKSSLFGSPVERKKEAGHDLGALLLAGKSTPVFSRCLTWLVLIHSAESELGGTMPLPVPS